MGEYPRAIVAVGEIESLGEVEDFASGEAGFDADAGVVADDFGFTNGHESDGEDADAGAHKIVPDDAGAGEAIHDAEDGEHFDFRQVMKKKPCVDVIERSWLEAIHQ